MAGTFLPGWAGEGAPCALPAPPSETTLSFDELPGGVGAELDEAPDEAPDDTPDAAQPAIKTTTAATAKIRVGSENTEASFTLGARTRADISFQLHVRSLSGPRRRARAAYPRSR